LINHYNCEDYWIEFFELYKLILENGGFMKANSPDVSTLNSLIATTIDSVDGYAEAAKDDESGRLAAMFNERSAERRKIVTKLQAEVARLGGDPEDDGTALAGAQRIFVNLKSVVTGKDDKAIVDEVERGEDHIKAKFEDALADHELSPEVMAVVRECYASVKSGHDQMRDIKHAMEGGR
jgi:uncharacterized protein (TIGR02284 family)